MVLRRDQSKNDLLEGNPFLITVDGQVGIIGGNQFLIPFADPAAEIPVNGVGPIMYLRERQVMVMRGSGIVPEVFNEPLRQCLRMVFNHLYQANGKHNAPPGRPASSLRTETGLLISAVPKGTLLARFGLVHLIAE
jgi:hypothetical protein